MGGIGNKAQLRPAGAGAWPELGKNAKLCKATFNEVIKRADDLVSNRESSQVLGSQASSSQWDIFRPQQNLAACLLEKSADHLEVTKFTQRLKMYIKTGFPGSPPETNIFMYIQPFIRSI